MNLSQKQSKQLIKNLKLYDIEVLLDRLTDEERLKIFDKYCTHCGDKNPKCQCWNDD